MIQKIAFWFYNLIWSFALPGLRFHHRLAEGYEQRTLKRGLAPANLWIQAASVGESYLALAIIENLRPANTARVLLTSNTRQGVDILARALTEKKKISAGLQISIAYFPFDKPAIMQTAVARIGPDVMVLLETELWPGLLRALKKRGCKTLLINGRMTDKSLKRYMLWPSVWQDLRPHRVLAISPSDADRFAQLFGPDGIEVMPNIKFDRLASATTSLADENPVKIIVPQAIPFVVLASVRRQEELLVKKIVQQLLRKRPQVVIGLFPRHLHRIQAWQEILNHAGIRWSLRSETKTQVTAGTVVLWDTFGEMLPAFKLCKSAFVGGSLAPLGGQNFLEALVSGVLPVIGPSWENFAWVGQEIITSGLLRVAGDWEEVAAWLLKGMDSRPPREEVITRTLQFLKAHQGGTAKACREIAACLEES